MVLFFLKKLSSDYRVQPKYRLPLSIGLTRRLSPKLATPTSIRLTKAGLRAATYPRHTRTCPWPRLSPRRTRVFHRRRAPSARLGLYAPCVYFTPHEWDQKVEHGHVWWVGTCMQQAGTSPHKNVQTKACVMGLLSMRHARHIYTKDLHISLIHPDVYCHTVAMSL
jgi:hypothetical protein